MKLLEQIVDSSMIEDGLDFLLVGMPELIPYRLLTFTIALLS